MSTYKIHRVYLNKDKEKKIWQYTQAIANSFKKQLLEADHNFASAGGDTFKIALYTSSATLNSATTIYSSNPGGGAKTEVDNTGQYVTGGGVLVNAGTSITAGVARCSFNDRSFTGVTLTARGALMYNTSSATPNSAVAVLDFTSDKTATSGTFTIQFPAATSTAAILRISG
jgi:hypothetical protein